MRVTHVRRHPVKSFQGEELGASIVDADGFRGDRAWGVRDAATGRILTGRREPRLLLAHAISGDDGEPTLTLPDGTTCAGTGPATDAALSAWLGQPVALVSAVAEGKGATAEFFADATDDSSPALEWTMPPGRFVDAAAVLLVTTATLRAGSALHPDGQWDIRRFRPNLVVDTDAQGWVEDEWCGRDVRVGDVVLHVLAPCERCTMVTRVQPGLERDVDVFKVLARHHRSTFGVWASVRTPGVVHVGDELIPLADRRD